MKPARFKQGLHLCNNIPCSLHGHTRGDGEERTNPGEISFTNQRHKRTEPIQAVSKIVNRDWPPPGDGGPLAVLQRRGKDLAKTAPVSVEIREVVWIGWLDVKILAKGQNKLIPGDLHSAMKLSLPKHTA